MGAVRRLLLVRHAKAARPDTVPDRERPLTDRGRRQGRALGALLEREDLVPDLVLSSDAVRARQTWELTGAALSALVPVRWEPRLYEAHPQWVVNLLAEVGDDVRTLLLVGHEPTLCEVAVGLAGAGSDQRLLAEVRAHLPTSGVVVLELDGSWSSLQAGRCRLTALLAPQA